MQIKGARRVWSTVLAHPRRWYFALGVAHKLDKRRATHPGRVGIIS